MLWRQLPVAHAESLVSITATRDQLRTDGAISYPDYVAFRERATTLSALAAHYSTAPLFVAVGSKAAEVNGAVVSANYFPLFEMRPALGRFFHADEDRVPDRDRVAVIGYDFWQSWFDGSPAAVGSVMTINGAAFTIIGIAPPQPVALTSMPVNLYIPTMMLRVGYRWCNDSLAADCTALTMVGRLSPRRTVSEAAAEFAAIMPVAWTHAPPGENSGVGRPSTARHVGRRSGIAFDRHARRRSGRSPDRLLCKPGWSVERAVSRALPRRPGAERGMR